MLDKFAFQLQHFGEKFENLNIINDYEVDFNDPQINVKDKLIVIL